jgi:hypothetical protein
MRGRSLHLVGKSRPGTTGQNGDPAFNKSSRMPAAVKRLPLGEMREKLVGSSENKRMMEG